MRLRYLLFAGLMSCAVTKETSEPPAIDLAPVAAANAEAVPPPAPVVPPAAAVAAPSLVTAIPGAAVAASSAAVHHKAPQAKDLAEAKKSPINISGEVIIEGSVSAGMGFLYFTVTRPTTLTIQNPAMYDCGLSMTKTTIYNDDQSVAWTYNGFPKNVETLALQPGSYYLELTFEIDKYTLHFRG